MSDSVLRNRKLPKKKQAYIDARAMGMTPEQAATAAGYSFPRIVAARLEHKDPDVRLVLTELAEETRKKFHFTRERVMELVDEGLGMARAARDPQAFFRGISEINKMQGYYEPEKRVIDVNVTWKDRVRQLESLSEEELLQRIGGEKGLILDGEFERADGVPLLDGPATEAELEEAGWQDVDGASDSGDDAEREGGPDKAPDDDKQSGGEELLGVWEVEAGVELPAHDADHDRDGGEEADDEVR
jgi:hypothetical protein